MEQQKAQDRQYSELDVSKTEQLPNSQEQTNFHSFSACDSGDQNRASSTKSHDQATPKPIDALQKQEEDRKSIEIKDLESQNELDPIEEPGIISQHKHNIHGNGVQDNCAIACSSQEKPPVDPAQNCHNCRDSLQGTPSKMIVSYEHDLPSPPTEVVTPPCSEYHYDDEFGSSSRITSLSATNVKEKGSSGTLNREPLSSTSNATHDFSDDLISRRQDLLVQLRALADEANPKTPEHQETTINSIEHVVNLASIGNNFHLNANDARTMTFESAAEAAAYIRSNQLRVVLNSDMAITLQKMADWGANIARSFPVGMERDRKIFLSGCLHAVNEMLAALQLDKQENNVGGQQKCNLINKQRAGLRPFPIIRKSVLGSSGDIDDDCSNQVLKQSMQRYSPSEEVLSKMLPSMSKLQNLYGIEEVYADGTDSRKGKRKASHEEDPDQCLRSSTTMEKDPRPQQWLALVQEFVWDADAVVERRSSTKKDLALFQDAVWTREYWRALAQEGTRRMLRRNFDHDRSLLERAWLNAEAFTREILRRRWSINFQA